MAELWRINNSPDVPDAQVESALDDIAHFVDEDTTDLMLQAPAANVRLPEDVNQVTLGDVVIRRLTNAEVTDLYGGLFSCFH